MKIFKSLFLPTAKIRSFVPFFGFISLVVLFLSLPEMSKFLGCSVCGSKQPYFSLIASAYFTFLISLALLFPSFPKSKKTAYAGLIWSILLALGLSYVKLPHWCTKCLIAHACHILMWIIWACCPALIKKGSSHSSFLLIIAPVSVVALFSSLNLTFMAYGFKAKSPSSLSFLQPGDSLPDITLYTAKGIPVSMTDEIVLNFLFPDCPYCKEQLPVVNKIASQLSTPVINIIPSLSVELAASAPFTDWFEDKEGKIREIFKISGYPTLVVVKDKKVMHVIAGLTDTLHEDLLKLIKSKE